MQRNMDLVRLILLRMEGSPSEWSPRDLGILGFTPEQIGYHVHIMNQEGLIDAHDVTPTTSKVRQALPTSLTWKGHEFLDLARDQERWNRAKAIIAKVGSAPISFWMKVLGDLLAQSVDSATAKIG